MMIIGYDLFYNSCIYLYPSSDKSIKNVLIDFIKDKYVLPYINKTNSRTGYWIEYSEKKNMYFIYYRIFENNDISDVVIYSFLNKVFKSKVLYSDPEIIKECFNEFPYTSLTNKEYIYVKSEIYLGKNPTFKKPLKLKECQDLIDMILVKENYEMIYIIYKNCVNKEYNLNHIIFYTIKKCIELEKTELLIIFKEEGMIKDDDKDWILTECKLNKKIYIYYRLFLCM